MILFRNEDAQPSNEENFSLHDAGHYGVIKFCVGALDGLLIQIGRPILRDTDNPDSFFSGHYHLFGFNCLGACDSHFRFTFFAVAAPGKTGDIRAMGQH